MEENQEVKEVQENEVEIDDVGKITMRKFNKKDWEIIRNNTVSINEETKKEKIDFGTFMKISVMLGIDEAPFFSTKYPRGMLITPRMYTSRENEYYSSEIGISQFDSMYKKICIYNQIDETEVAKLKKK